MVDKICIIDGCKSAQAAKGYCDNHYRLAKRNGSPLIKKKASNGELLNWVRSNCQKDTNECIIWPFALKSNGYASFRQNYKMLYAHREVCKIAHGGPPTPKHHAAHSCNNRACVNAGHLRWATAEENAKDKTKHGTQPYGEKVHNAKLTKEQVRVIRNLRGKAPQSKIGEMFGITQSHVKDIQLGKCWKEEINGN
jgi:hypothetical protein